MGKYPSWNCRQLDRRLREIGCELLRTTEATGITVIPSVPTDSSPLRGIRAMCLAASLPTSSKTSASAATIFTSRDFEPHSAFCTPTSTFPGFRPLRPGENVRHLISTTDGHGWQFLGLTRSCLLLKLPALGQNLSTMALGVGLPGDRFFRAGMVQQEFPPVRTHSSDGD